MLRWGLLGFIPGAVLGIALSLAYFTMGGPSFLGLPIEIVFFPGVASEEILSRLFELNEESVPLIMLLFVASNAASYGLVSAAIACVARALTRTRGGIRATCGYDLRGTTAAGKTECPECGALITKVVRAGRR